MLWGVLLSVYSSKQEGTDIASIFAGILSAFTASEAISIEDRSLLQGTSPRHTD